MADLQLGSQIGGNLIWHQGNLELNPSTHLLYKTAQLIDDTGGQTIKGSLTLQGQLIASSVLVSAAQNSAANALTRKDYVDTHINDYVHINKLKELGTTDLNTLLGDTFSGYYKQSSNSNTSLARNYPVLLAGYLTVRAFGGNTYQEYTTYNYGFCYNRAATNSVYGPWKAVLNDYDNQDITGRKTFIGSGALTRLWRNTTAGNMTMEFAGVGEARIGLFGCLDTNNTTNPGMELRADRGAIKIISTSGDVNIIAGGGGAVNMDYPRAFKSQENVINALTRKDYVDGLINNIGNTAVTLTTNQTITGQKTFQRDGGSVGTIQIKKQTATGTNYIDYRDEAGIRQGFIGQLSTTAGVVDMQFRAEQAGGRIKIYTADGNIEITPSGVGKFTSITLPRSASTQENTPSALVRKDYTDGLDAQNVKLTGNQRIDGVKTFLGTTIFSGNLRVDTINSQGLEFFRAGTTRIGGSGFGSIQLRPMGVDDDTVIYDFGTNGQFLLPVAGTDAKSAVQKTYVDTLNNQNVKLTGIQTVKGRKYFEGEGAISQFNRGAVGQDNYIAFGGVGESRMGYLGNTDKSANPYMRLVADRGNLSVSAHVNVIIQASTGLTVIDKPTASGSTQYNVVAALTRKDYVDAHINNKIHINTPITLGATNLNTLFGSAQIGYFRQTQNENATPANNYPVPYAGYLTVDLISEGQCTQVYTTYNTGERYSRCYEVNTWSAWNGMVTTGGQGTQNIHQKKAFYGADNVINVNRDNTASNNFIEFGGVGEGAIGFVGNSERTTTGLIALHANRGGLNVTAAAGDILISTPRVVNISNPCSTTPQGIADNSLIRWDYAQANFASIGILVGVDLNNTLKSGFYRITEPVNGPPGVNYSQMIVSQIQDTAMQIVIDYTNDNMWYRTKSPTAWTVWNMSFSTQNVLPIANIPAAPRDNGGGRGGFWWTYDGVSLGLNA